MKLENFDNIWESCTAMIALMRDYVHNYQTDVVYDAASLCKMHKNETAYQVFRKNGTNWYREGDLKTK